MKPRKEYSTRQREMILELFRENDRQFLTAGEIIAHLRARGCCIGATTVYRTLNLLTDNGQLRRYTDTGEGACYQLAGAECDRHLHLRCNRCSQILHLDCSYKNKLTNHLLQNHGFIIDPQKTVLYGTCEDCREEEETV